MIKKLFLAILTCLVGLCLTERAHALSYRKITDEEMKSMANRIIAIGKASDDKEEMKDLLDIARRVRPIVELVDAKCPMPIKVANGTNVPVFNVEISVSERRGLSGTRVPQTFHVPYIPPKSVVSGTISCAISSYSYGYQAYGDRDIYMSASPIADHSRLDEEGIKKMLRTNPDLTTTSYDFSSASSVTSRTNELDAILGRDAGAGSKTTFNAARPTILSVIFNEIDDDDDFKFFVQGLLRSNEGAAALGKWVRTAPAGTHTKIAPLLATAQPAKVRAMLEEAMKATVLSASASGLFTAAVTRVCGPGQPEAERTSMWLAALGKDVVNQSTRETVLEKCGVGKEQTRARLKAAKPEQLGRALDGMTGDLFDVAVAAMTESKSFGAASTLLAATQNNEKFLAVSKAALGFATPAQRDLLIRNVASGATGALDGAKAKWLTERLDELHGSGGDAPVLRQIFGDMANGLVANAAVRKVAYARWKDAGKDAFDPFMTALASRSHILAPAWIRSQAEKGELDLVELLAAIPGSSSTGLGAIGGIDATDDDDDDDHSVKPTPKAGGKLTATKTSVNTCHADSKSADACLTAVKSLSLTKDAIDPAFTEAVSSFIRTSPRDAVAAKVATELAALGVDLSDAVDALCKAAPTDPGRWGYGSGSEDPLTTAAALNAGHPCIASVKSARSSAERWIAAGIGFRVTLALVPFGFVGLFARKRFVPVRAQLAKESAELEAVRGQAAITMRLAAPKTEEALAAGLTDAATFLTTDTHEEVAGAGRALGALSAERRNAILGKTRAMATRAAETGNASTFLAELDGIVLYVACFPGREDQPQTVRRHPGFTDGWPEHIKGIVDACIADGRPNKILSLVFMLGASGGKTTMLVGFDTPAIHFVPESLAAHDNEITHGHRYELSLGQEG